MMIVLGILIVVVVAIAYYFFYYSTAIPLEKKVLETTLEVEPKRFDPAKVRASYIGAFLDKYEYAGHFVDKSDRAIPIQGPRMFVNEFVPFWGTKVLPYVIAFQDYRREGPAIFMGERGTDYKKYGEMIKLPRVVDGIKYGWAFSNAVYTLKD